jgi:hypothetical protein
MAVERKVGSFDVEACQEIEDHMQENKLTALYSLAKLYIAEHPAPLQ